MYQAAHPASGSCLDLSLSLKIPLACVSAFTPTAIVFPPLLPWGWPAAAASFLVSHALGLTRANPTLPNRAATSHVKL